MLGWRWREQTPRRKRILPGGCPGRCNLRRAEDIWELRGSICAFQGIKLLVERKAFK